MVFWLCEIFFEIFLMSPKGRPFIFKFFKGPHFTIFGIVRFFKVSIFCLKIRFPQNIITVYCVFLRLALFPCAVFLICFYQRPFHFSIETKPFANIQNSLLFSALCDLSETYIKRNFSKFDKTIPQVLVFWKSSVGEKVVFESYTFRF